MTRFVFAGAEVPSHRILLTDNGVKHIGVNFWRLTKRGLPTTKQFLFSEKIPADVRVYLYPGEPDEATDLATFTAAYVDFANANAESLEAVLEVTQADHKAQALHRDTLLGYLGDDVVWVLWDGKGNIDTIAQQFQHVVISGDVLSKDTTLHGRLRALQGIYGTRWHALAYAHPDDLRALPLDTVSTHAWLAPMLRGETVVWDGTKLSRYPQKMKDQARLRLSAICERAGLDFGKIKADDHNEVAKLAIWSYLQLEKNMDRKDRPFTLITGEGALNDGEQQRPDQSEYVDDPGDAEMGGEALAHSDVAVRNPRLLEVRPVDEQMALPVFGFDVRQSVEKDADGNDVVVDQPVVKSTHATLRQCNTCFVQSNCPAFKPNNTCAFNLPVSVQTKDQLRALLTAIIEMQGSRVAFARFAEELNGGYPDPNVSQEMDRLFKLVKIVKELEDNREFIKITAERSSGAGVLSAIFGDRAQTLRELPGGGLTEEQTDKILRDGPAT